MFQSCDAELTGIDNLSNQPAATATAFLLREGVVMWIRFALFNAALAGILTAQPRKVLTSLSVSPASVSLMVGSRVNAAARATTVVPASIVTRFSTGDTAVAVVDSVEGVVVARRAGVTSLRVRVHAEAEGFEAGELTVLVPITVK